MPTAYVRSRESVVKDCIRKPNPLVHGLTNRPTFHPLSIHNVDNRNVRAMDELQRRSRIGSRLRTNHTSGIEPRTGQ
ncbi:hypothetical protein Poly51_55810 [Rubripirellula tenax]|uniref:Uncharacterized protein n=1 Tax=Rubripirellula tenax TaxID=2528015 RepID=A0A5C6EF25_9BACT|nr:hypothetical protein Poly51_55810 [Rubripirellula tenax]